MEMSTTVNPSNEGRSPPGTGVDRFERFRHVSTRSGEALIYDVDVENAWIQSDTFQQPDDYY